MCARLKTRDEVHQDFVRIKLSGVKSQTGAASLPAGCSLSSSATSIMAEEGIRKGTVGRGSKIHLNGSQIHNF